MSTLRDKIRSRGYWTVIIRPVSFVPTRLSDMSQLYRLVEKSSVRLRGWDYPHISSKVGLHIDVDWVGQESEYINHIENWRLYCSGQFAHMFAMREDWLELRGTNSADRKPGSMISLVSTVFTYSEIFEFAARLALTEAGDEQMHIEIDVNKLNGRELWLDEAKYVGFDREYTARIDAFPHKIELPKGRLIAEPRELAIQQARELFLRFGLDADPSTLREMQAELHK